MSAVTCPNGHPSVSTDYCDVCGAADRRRRPHRPRPPSRHRPSRLPAPAAAGDPDLPELLGRGRGGRAVLRELRLRLHHRDDAAAGAALDLRRPRARGATDAAAPASRRVGGRTLGRPGLVRRTAERRPVPVARPAGGVPLTEKSVLVGRPSRSRGIHPEVDCGDDTGVSRRQAQLTTDGTALVGRGPAVLQRHLRRPRPAARCPRTRSPGPTPGAGRRRPGLRRRLDPSRRPQVDPGRTSRPGLS